ncbi:MAG TPA: hypothetical protein VGO81_08585 [Solirubrobacteraceae bacterium]|nr:hypothetical protein [Solirubrobacteraceae bacterium]
MRHASLPAVTVSVAVLVGGCGGGTSDEQQVRDAARALTRALAAGDYGRACGLFSLEAQSQVEAATAGARDCAAALRQSRRVAAAAGTGMPTIREIDAATLTLSNDRAMLSWPSGALDPQRFEKYNDRWLVAADSPASGQRSFAACWRRAGASIATTPDDLRFAAAFVRRTQQAGQGPSAANGQPAGGGVNYIYADGWVIFYQYGIDEPTNSEVISDPSTAIAVGYVHNPRRVQTVVTHASDC